jgi:hypothetical protein
VFAPGSGSGSASGPAPHVLAVLDWELSTLGDPLADLAYSAMPFHLTAAETPGLALPDVLPEGIPEEAQYVDAYCRARGIERPSQVHVRVFACGPCGWASQLPLRAEASSRATLETHAPAPPQRPPVCCRLLAPPPPSPWSQADWSFYLALSLFRIASIAAGVAARAAQGNASSRTATEASVHSPCIQGRCSCLVGT